ncbi:MAG: hypothetical protein JWQ92_2199 [Amnibacterium sp.]|nr:hypothetical protein [Amnibacterium sp.]
MLLVATVGVLSWWPAILLMGRRPSLAGQALTILLAEAALHATFTLGAAPSSALVVPRPGAVLGPMPGMPAEAPMAAMAAPTAAMWTAHAVAAVLTVVAWNRGEAAFWALVRLAHRLSPVPVPERTHDERPRLRALVATRWDPSPAHHLERVVAVRPRRGPPPVPNR